MIVTLDGPAGAGKSSTAGELARRLGWCHMDTGAMYRSVAFLALRDGVPLDDEAGLARIAETMRIEFRDGGVWLEGIEVNAAIRTPEITAATRPVANAPLVREAMKRVQRRMARDIDVVTEGRDQGSEVFPDAELKVFLTASPLERARRRLAEERRRGRDTTLEQILASQEERDDGDTHRAVGAMRRPDGAELLVTDGMGPEEVILTLLSWVETRRAAPGRPAR